MRKGALRSGFPTYVGIAIVGSLTFSLELRMMIEGGGKFGSSLQTQNTQTKYTTTCVFKWLTSSKGKARVEKGIE